MNDEIENLARLMWASWGGIDPDKSWLELDEKYKFKWKAQAEVLIDNGYRKNKPEELVALDEPSLRRLYSQNLKEYGTLPLNVVIENFIHLICQRFGTSTAMVPTEIEIMEALGWRETLLMQGVALNNKTEVFYYYYAKAKAIHDLITGEK